MGGEPVHIALPEAASDSGLSRAVISRTCSTNAGRGVRGVEKGRLLNVSNDLRPIANARHGRPKIKAIIATTTPAAVTINIAR
jgi:hypothetical protein